MLAEAEAILAAVSAAATQKGWRKFFISFDALLVVKVLENLNEVPREIKGIAWCMGLRFDSMN